MRCLLLLVSLLGGCALNAGSAPGARQPRASAGISSAACERPPEAADGNFRRTRNRVFASLGQPRHRGIDLIAVEGDANQTLGGKLAYTAADKDLVGEDVELFVCLERAWQSQGTTRTGRSGRFELALRAQLPAGMHDVYAHVPGDGSGVRFLAYIARADEQVIVTDVDGTITESENAIFNTVLFGDDIGHRHGAPAALASSGHKVVYVTARGDQFTEVTRRWLQAHGFPPGPVRLARAQITPPGKQTVAFKLAALRELRVPVAAAVGNKQSDIDAYTRAGVAASRIFIKLPEFAGEVGDAIASNRAVGFREYGTLPDLMNAVGFASALPGEQVPSRHHSPLRSIR